MNKLFGLLVLAALLTGCENGGITKISQVDSKVKNILDVIGEYTTTVYGE